MPAHPLHYAEGSAVSTRQSAPMVRPATSAPRRLELKSAPVGTAIPSNAPVLLQSGKLASSIANSTACSSEGPTPGCVAPAAARRRNASLFGYTIPSTAA